MGKQQDDKVHKWNADFIMRKTATSLMEEIANQQQGDSLHVKADLVKDAMIILIKHSNLLVRL